MAEINGGRLAAKQLKASGIDTIFTVAAGPMVQVLIGAVEEGIRVVNCRHDLSAANAASAWGWVNKKPGVVVLGSGPGTTNGVTGLYVATDSAMPLVVLGGSVGTGSGGLGAFQETDQVRFAAPGSKWASRIGSVRQMPDMMHLALGKAISGRPGGVYLDFPGHMVSETIEDGSIPLRTMLPEVTAPHPDPRAVEKVAEMLANAERPLVLIGKGAAWADAAEPLRRLVDRGIPFVASPMGRGTIPDDHELSMSAARNNAIRGADVVLMVGAKFNWMFQQGMNLAKGVRVAQIDVEPEEMFSIVDVEVGLVADCAVAVDQIEQALRGRTLKSASSDWVSSLKETALKNSASLEEEMLSDASPINHHRLVADVRDVVDRDAFVIEEGEVTMGIMRQLMPSYLPRRRLGAGSTGCMGVGFPYAVGAKLAHPEAQVVAVLGDYAFGAAAMEIETCARLGINVVVVVSNNAGISAHTMQARFPADAPPVGAMLPADYEKMAEMVGAYAQRVTEPGDIKPAIQRALASNSVAIVNVITDPDAGKGRRAPRTMYI